MVDALSEAIPRVCRSVDVRGYRRSAPVTAKSGAVLNYASDNGLGWRLGPPIHFQLRRDRRGSLETSVDMQVRLLPGLPPTRPDGDGSSLQNCDSGFNSSRVCHVAKPLLPGSSPGSHSIGGREATATLSGPENQRSGKDPDGGSTPPPSATTLKFLIFCDRFTYYVIA